MKKTLIISSIAIIFTSVLLFQYAETDSIEDQEKDFYGLNDAFKYISPEIPEQIDFSGEAVPVDTLYVRESLERELLVNSYFHSNTFLLVKRSARWFPVISTILAEHGIPDDFKYVALIESGLQNVVSPRGASGYWQFMKTTAKEYDLTVNSQIDERYHVEKATQSACQYFKDAYAKYHNWTLVAASYNMGMGGLDKRLRQQKVDSYYDLKLNSETSRYVYRLLAVKNLFENLTEYGFYIRFKDTYQPFSYDLLKVDTSILNLAEFAISKGINYKILKEYNPWLRTNELTIYNGKPIYIKLPSSRDLSWKEQMNKIEKPHSIIGLKKDSKEIDE